MPQPIPLVVNTSFFLTKIMTSEPARPESVRNDDERLGLAFEGAMQSQEYGIPPGSRHYRAELQQFGDLSLPCKI
jgi:hypothetical protein